MLEMFSGFDGQIDWTPLVAGIVTITLGLSFGHWLWKQILIILVGLAYLIVILGIPFILIATNTLTTWQEMAFSCGFLGILIAVFFFPFLKLYEMSQAIKFIEKKFDITDADIRKFTSGEKKND